MNILTIGGKEYEFKYTIKASLYKELVSTMFKVLTGGYVANGFGINGSVTDKVSTMFSALGEFTAEIPGIVVIMWHGGLLQKHPMSTDESFALLEQYMDEIETDFNSLFEKLKGFMESDGFFDRSGITKMITALDQTNKQLMENVNQKKK